MVMLSELLFFDLIDAENKRARLADLSLDVLEDDYPAVAKVYFRSNGDMKQLPWSEVENVDLSGAKIKISDLDRAETRKHSQKDVLLKRDILDALIIDLLGRRTTRVGDLRLELDNKQLRLKAADIGIGAMLRRITRGYLGRSSKRSMFDWKYVEFLRGDPQAVRNGAGYRMRIRRLPPAEIARLADYIPYLHAAELLKLLPDEKAADVLEAMSLERQLQVIEELEENEAVELLTRMSPDLATDLIGRLHVETMRRYLGLMPPRNANRIIELLRYPENSVGGVMINELICVPIDMTIGDAGNKVRDSLKRVDFAPLLFVVENEETNKLLGAITLRDILINDEARPLFDIMDPYVETLDPFQNATDAAHRIVNGQLDAMPVVEKEGNLIGAMTIDAAISRLAPATSSLQTLRVFS